MSAEELNYTSSCGDVICTKISFEMILYVVRLDHSYWLKGGRGASDLCPITLYFGSFCSCFDCRIDSGK